MVPTLDEQHAPDSATKGSFGSTDWPAVIGWRKLTGRVIAIDQPYQVSSGRNWFVVLLCLIIFLGALPLILGAIVGLKIGLSWFKLFESHSSRRQEQPGIGSQLVSFFLYGALFGPKKTHTVRDIRLRDDQGREYLVRIAGDFTAGNVNTGDEIEVFGWNKRGTLIFYRGRNLRTGSDLLTKQQ